MVGTSGAGKSFFAEHFSQTFSTPLVSWKVIRDELFNDPIYSDDEDAIVGRVANHMLDELYKTQATIIYESSIQSQTHRQDIAQLAKKAGYETLLVWVQTDKATAKSRASKNGLTPRQYQQYAAMFMPPTETERPVVISGKHTYASQLKIVLGRLSQSRAKPDLIIRSTVPVRTSSTR